MTSVQDINKLRDKDHAMYQGAVEMLRTEAAEDELSRSRHGTDRWNRQPSHIAAGNLAKQVTEYEGILRSAENTDKLVRNKLSECEDVLRLLGGRLHAIEEFVPNSSRATLTPKMDREVVKLRQCMNDVSRHESRRRRKVEAIRQKAKADDISEILFDRAPPLTC